MRRNDNGSGEERTWIFNEQASTPHRILDGWMPQNSLGPLFSPAEALFDEKASAPRAPLDGWMPQNSLGPLFSDIQDLYRDDNEKTGRERTEKAPFNEQASAPHASLHGWMPQNSLGPVFANRQDLYSPEFWVNGAGDVWLDQMGNMVDSHEMDHAADMIFVISFTPAICLTSRILPEVSE